MNWNKELRIISSMILLLISSHISAQISQWQSKSIQADGIANEYQIPLNYYDFNSKIQYTISNDLENIYFCIRAVDNEAQMKILQAGMQIMIDTTGKKKAFATLFFPLLAKPNLNEMPKERIERDLKNQQKTKRRKVPEFINEFRLEGFKVLNNERIPLQNNTGIQVAIQFDSLNNLIYEGIIPFKTFYKDKLTSADSLKTFNIMFVINALPKAPSGPSSQRPPMDNQDGFQGGNGGVGFPQDNNTQERNRMNPQNGTPGSELRPPSGEGSMPDNTNFTKVNKIKIKYRLSVLPK